MVREISKTQALEIGLFLIKFNILLIPFYAIAYYEISFFALQELYAKFLVYVLSFLGFQATASSVFIFLDKYEFPINISFDCLGWKSSYSLFALVFATPGEWRDKLKFLRFWVLAFVVINFVRIMSTVLIGYSFGFPYIEPVHTYFWQFAMIAIVLGVWFLWLKRRVSIKK